MQTATSTEVQNKFGEYLEKARSEAVQVTRSGRAAAVMISPEDYKWFQTLEDAYWLDRAREAAKQPLLPPGEFWAGLERRMAEPS